MMSEYLPLLSITSRPLANAPMAYDAKTWTFFILRSYVVRDNNNCYKYQG